MAFKDRRWPRSIIHFIALYFNNCCIHGFRYLVKAMLVVFEKFLWLVLLFVSIYFCIVVCLSSIDRYYTKSTHIGLERNYYFWNTTFPSVTICPMHRLDSALFGHYCRKNGIKGTQKTVFWDFLENLANSTYINFQNIPESDEIDQIIMDIGLKPEHYMEIIYNLTFDSTYDPFEINRTRCLDGQSFIHVRQVLTEYGLCYLGNTKLGLMYSSRYLIFRKYPKFNKYDTKPHFDGSFFSPDNQYTVAGLTSPSIDTYLHSPHEVMKADDNFGYSIDGIVFEAYLEEIIAEDNLESETTVTMRKCRFHHESNLTHFPFYTKNVCMQECRINLAYKLCKCIPHFYPNRITNPKTVCDYKTLRSCFPRYTSYFLRLYDENGRDKEPHACYCEQNCLDTIVSVRAALPNFGTKSLLQGRIGCAVSVRNWPENRLKRQVIFSVTDLLVSIGGTAGLFLGFSVLGLVEVLYFFTIRLIWQSLGYTL